MPRDEKSVPRIFFPPDLDPNYHFRRPGPHDQADKMQSSGLETRNGKMKLNEKRFQWDTCLMLISNNITSPKEKKTPCLLIQQRI